MWLLQLAFRNIFRNFRRSALSFSAISIGLAVIIISMGFTRGFEQQAIRTVIHTRTGDVKIFSHGYWAKQDQNPLEFSIEGYQSITEKLSRYPEVSGMTPRLRFNGNLSDGRGELPAQGFGVLEDEENSVFPFSRSIIKGRCFNRGEEAVVLGKGLADLFGVEVGGQITIIARTRYEALTALDLNVAGIIYTENPEIDNFYFFIPLDVAQSFLEMENAITEVALKLSNRAEAAQFCGNIVQKEPAFSRLDAVSWEEMTKDLLKFFEFRKKARMLISAVLILMAAAGIANTMLMATYERIREIGMMMAIGMKPKMVVGMFSLESAYIGLFGSLLGCLSGGGLTYYFAVYGLDISKFGITNTGAMYLPHKVYADLTPDMIVFVFLLGIFIAFAAGLYPAVHAAKLKPVQAMRTV